MRDLGVGRWTGVALMAGLLCAGATYAQDAKRQLDPAFPNYQPPYPDAAQVNGEQGDVGLKVRVNENGRVRNIEIERSSGFDDLDNAAIEGVLRWRYLPSEHWSSWEHVTIVYRLPTAASVAPPAAPASPH